MTERKFEPAKIIGKVDLKKDDKENKPDDNLGIDGEESQESNADGPLSTGMQDAAISPTDRKMGAATESTANSAASSEDTSDQVQETVPPLSQAPESMTDLLHQYAEQDRADIEAWEKNSNALVGAPGVAADRPTVKEMVDEVKRLIVEFVGKGLEAIGAYLLVNVFDGNFKKALSKDPYKGTSLNDLARHKEIPLSRQRLAECIRSAGVGAELESLGLHLDWLTFFHKVEISKLKNPEIRVQLAREAHEKELTVNEVRDRVKKLTGKSISSDKQMVKTLIRQLRDVARLTADDDTREFLLDKDRLKEALDKGETAQLLDSSEKFRKASAESREVLQLLETTLEDIVLERRQDQEDGPDKANA
jgi:hypothetical protein